MSFNYDEGFDNSAYHYSETLEVDRRQHGRVSPQMNTSFRQNPYDTYEDVDEGRQSAMDYSAAIPLSPMNQRTENIQLISASSMHNVNPYGSGYYNPAFDSETEYADRPASNSYGQDGYTRSNSDRHTEVDGNENMLRRRNRQSTLPVQLMNASNNGATDSLLEIETAMYIKKLASMSANERTKEIQKLPIVLKRKRELRDKVQEAKNKKSKKGGSINCCTQCMYSITLSFRRSKEFISDVFQSMRLWQKTLKKIGGKFGTSVLSYFIFLKWLLTFNIFSFVVNFSFITIPQLVDLPPNNRSFSGLELLTGAGYFQETVLYYGFYTNSTIHTNVNLTAYNMQLAYIFTIGFYLLICFLSLIYSMAKSFRENFISPNIFSTHATKLLCAWDFSVTHEKAIKERQTNLSTQIKEALSDILHEKLKLSIGQRIVRFLIHLLAWVLSMGTAAGCCAAIYYLSKDEVLKSQAASKSELDLQATTLVLPVVVAIINLIMPFIYELFGLVEKFKYPRHETYVLILRNVFLKISIIGVLCYYWMEIVAESTDRTKCWETLVGEDIYRLIMFDFIFSLLGSFFGEFMRRIIGIKCCKKLGMPEFDIARNVLDLIYAQTLAWIGIFFSPLLPVIQILKLFIIFYVKKVSLMMNCVPPRRAWRASQMTTVFIFLLFFPSFTGVLSVVGITVWSRNSSSICGPFRNLDHPFSAVSSWVDSISWTTNLQWVVWIYHNLIESVLFFFILTLIVLIISYLYWQIIQGRKIMVKLLQEQIANEGKKKKFLLEELNQLQKRNGVASTKHSNTNGSAFKEPQTSYRSPEKNQFAHGSEMYHPPMREGVSESLAVAMIARQQAVSEGYRPPSPKRGASDALAIAMMAKQQTESEGYPPPSMRGGGSEGLALALEARQQAESEEHQLSRMKSFGTEVLRFAKEIGQQDDSEGHEQYTKEGGHENMVPDANAWQTPHSEGYQLTEGSDAFALAMRAKEQANLQGF